MIALGVVITSAAAATLVIEFFRHKRGKFAAYGWVGFAGLIIAEVLIFRGVLPLAIYFTPIAWTCYILITDAAVLSIRGRSRIHDEPGQIARIALLSIPLWTIFELYNLRLQNWTYVGVPIEWPLAILGYCWSFATITPGILQTADLIESFGWFRVGAPVRFSSAMRWAFVVFGASCLIAPLALPQHLAAYLFALVWVGFVFLLDPMNYRLKLPSIIGDLAKGYRGWFYSLMLSGFVCGWLWEFWNFWAAAKWHYIFPILQDYKIFEMPFPGYLGFIPFALECFVMYVTAAWAIGLMKPEGASIAEAQDVNVGHQPLQAAPESRKFRSQFR
jgi:hypothetical protein